MRVFNTIFDLVVSHPSFGVRLAATFALIVANVCFIGGAAVIANGLYWTWVRLRLKKSARFIAERTQRLGFEPKA